MRPYRRMITGAAVATLALASVAGLAPHAWAHCDTLDGPVVKDARKALAEGKATRVLKWVKARDEGQVKLAFSKALVERKQGGKARSAADMRFFTTLVRVHRAGEGAPFTGLKPSGTDLGPAVQGADKALVSGSVDALVRQATREVEKGIRERFAHARQTRKSSESNVEAGRRYVASYIEYVHYVERLHDDATAKATGHEHEGEPTAHKE
ncbi:MAG TPA: DUF6448 family protein [Armatimonadota bacterium]